MILYVLHIARLSKFRNKFNLARRRYHLINETRCHNICMRSSCHRFDVGLTHQPFYSCSVHLGTPVTCASNSKDYAFQLNIR